MQFNSQQISDLLKPGSKHLSGLEEAVYRNIEACKGLATMTKTSFGPTGMNKMVVNHLGKLFVTSDSGAILEQIDVQHPAAKLLIDAMAAQENECGDHTNYVLVFAGELLAKADALLRMGIHGSDIVLGYQMALEKVGEEMESLAVDFPVDLHSAESLTAVLTPVIASKQYGYEEHFASVIGTACAQVMPENVLNFNVDNIRVAKMVGGDVLDTAVVKGMVVGRRPETTIQTIEGGRVAVFAQAISAQSTETKGTVLMHNADELLSFSKAEEDQMEGYIKGIADSGANVVLTGGKISDIALHFLNKYNLLAVKVLSKFQLRRLCKAVGAKPLVNLGVPSPDDLGFCDRIDVKEIGSTFVTVFEQSVEDSGISTILIRGATMNILDDVSRAVDDGVNTIKALTKVAVSGKPALVAGAGAFELELATKIADYADQQPGVVQYAIRAFSEALEVVPRALAENSGFDATKILADLYSAHKSGSPHAGVDIETGEIVDALEAGIVDVASTKSWGMMHAVDAASTVVSVDELIVARAAGGPKPPAMAGRDA